MSAGPLLVRSAHNFSKIINIIGLGQIQGAMGRKERVEVRHPAVLPEKGTAIIARITGLADDLAKVIDPVGIALDIAGKRAQVADGAVPPKDGMRGGVTGEVGETHHFAEFINLLRGVVHVAPEGAEVDCPAVLPQQGMGLKIRVAIPGKAGHLAAVVVGDGLSVRVAPPRGKGMDVAILPDGGQNLKNLWGHTG